MNNLDDLFHQKLYGAEVPPPPAVWPLVERELRRRRRRMLGWWFFAGAAVLGMAAYWSLWRMPQQPDLAAAKAPLPLGSGPSSPEAAHRLEAPALAGAAAAPATAAPHKGLRLEAAEPTRAVAQGGSAVVLSAATQRAQALAKPEETISAAPLPASAEAAGERPSADPAPAAAQAEAPSAAAQPTEEAALAIRQLPLLPAIGYAELAEPVAGHIARIPLAAARIRKKPNKHQHCYDFSAHPNVLLLDAYAGPSLARKELRTTTPEDSWYRQRRLSTERRDWAFNAGLRATLLLNQHFLIRSGLHYDQMVEVFEYADPNYKEVNIRQRSVLVNGMWKTVSDTTVSYGEHYTKTYNRLGMLDIPLQVGVEMRNGRSGLSLQAGASLNVLFWSRGTLLSMTEQPVSFEQADMFRPRAGLSVSGSVQWFYHLRKRTRVFAEPYYRQVLKPVTTSSQPLEQRYGIGGLRLGITQIMD